MWLEAATFVVVDTETTGTGADDRIIELAAVRLKGGQIIDHFSRLVNPGRSIPLFITQLTGISTAMLVGQPTAADILPEFLDFLGDGVLVAHNVAFDQRMLEGELRRLGLPWPNNPTLCTLRLARRLLPGLPKKGLDGLAQFFRLQSENRHRALGDALLTAQVLLRLLESVRKQGIQTLEALLAFQYQPYQTHRPDPLARLRTEVLPHLPAEPGVYLFRDGCGRLLYVGKARNLQARVRQYFTAVEAHPPRLRQLMAAVRHVEWRTTATELEAFLEESFLIKTHHPCFNRAQLRYRTRPFLRLDVVGSRFTLTTTPFLMEDGAVYFGPLPSRRQALVLLEALGTVFEWQRLNPRAFLIDERPCPGWKVGICIQSCWEESRQVKAPTVACLQAFLCGKRTQPLQLLETMMRTAAARLDFEAAARYRDQLRALERFIRRLQTAPALLQHAVVLVRETSERLAACLVCKGRPVAIQAFRWPPEEEVLMNWIKVAQGIPLTTGLIGYDKRETEAMRLVHHWLWLHRNRGVIVPWDSTETEAARWRRLREGLHQITLSDWDDVENVQKKRA